MAGGRDERSPLLSDGETQTGDRKVTETSIFIISPLSVFIASETT